VLPTPVTIDVPSCLDTVLAKSTAADAVQAATSSA
jgi:hypothetical protein